MSSTPELSPPDSSTPPSLDAEGLESLGRLKRVLELSEGFLLGIVVAETTRVLDDVLSLLPFPSPPLRLRPQRSHLDTPEIQEKVGLQVLESLTLTLTQEKPRPLLLDATGGTSVERPGWAELFRRLNERRNGVVNTWPETVLLCIPPWLEPVLAHEAPDLWALRSITIRLEDKTPHSAQLTEPESRTLTERSVPWLEDPVEAQRLVDEARAEGASLEIVSARLVNLSNALAGRGARQEALAAIREATEGYRRLEEERPEAFLPGLAASLNNLGTRLYEMGRREEALLATEEAFTLYRRLAEKAPKVFLPDLAASLNNLGNGLSDLGRWEEALLATQAAVTLARRLAEKAPDAFLPDLARSLNNLGNVLSDLERWEEALLATEEAVNLRRRLAEKVPDAFLPDLARSLNNLGNVLSDLERWEEALLATEEAVNLRRRLAEKVPDAFLPDLARSLNNLGNVLSDLERWEEALLATEEAVAHHRRLADKAPDAFLPDLAMSLNNLGNRLSALGRREEAFEAVREGLKILAPFYQKHPKAFAQDFTLYLRNLRNLLLQFHQDPAQDPDLAPYWELLRETEESPANDSNAHE